MRSFPSLSSTCAGLTLLLAAALCFPARAEVPVVRVAVLKYGTAAWELELIRERGLDRAHGFRLELIQRVSPNASLVALQGGAADLTVGDWLWVAKQRDAGRDFRYYPYSTAIGELLVPAASSARKLVDLEEARIGVAGGAEDKSWLLFQAYAQRENLDLLSYTEPRYAAPPLLNGLATTGELDAVLTYWHYAARLKAEGYRSLLSLDTVLERLSVRGPVPMLGWIFAGAWADSQRELVDSFLRASYAAKRQLLEDDAAWAVVRPMMQADDAAVFTELQAGYRAGVPRRFGEDEMDAIRQVALIVGESLRARGRAGAASEQLSDAFWRIEEASDGPDD